MGRKYNGEYNMLEKVMNEHYIDFDLLPEAPTVVDLGFCLGDFYYAIKDKVKVFDYYIGIDPCETNCAMSSNIENIKIYQVAVDGNIGKDYIEFNEFIGMPRWGNTEGINLNTTHNKLERIDTYLVPLVSSNEFFEFILVGNIDFLKIDIEGAEERFVVDLPDTDIIEIGQITIELHDNVNVSNIVNKLENNNFNVQVFGTELYAVNNEITNS